MRSLLAVNPRFPVLRKSAQGQSEPKARPKGVVDGWQVNIPAPLRKVTTDGGTRARASGALTDGCARTGGVHVGKSACIAPKDARSSQERRDAINRQENPLGTISVSVPKPTQVGEVNIPRRSSEPLERN